MTPSRDLFSQHRLRCTRQRLALYDALRQCLSHPTAEELYRMVRAGTSELSRATVYNTLEALCRAGLVRRLPTTNGCCRFDADVSDHLHLRLRDTAEIRDVPEDLGAKLRHQVPKAVLNEIEERMGVKIEDIHIQLVGRATDSNA